MVRQKRKSWVDTQAKTRRIAKTTRVSKHSPARDKKVMTQLQIKPAVKANHEITCKECWMPYSPSSAVDLKMHTVFHSRALEGRDWPLVGSNKGISVNNAIGGYVVKVDAGSRPIEKRVARDLLELANTELSAPLECQNWCDNPGQGAAFLYILGSKAIGVLAVERASKGHWMSLQTQSIVSNEAEDILMGISRIYTVKNHRRKQVGATLLEVAAREFIYGLTINKTQVAWSQPSFSGSMLARKWFGSDSNILAYTESSTSIK